MKNLKVMLSLMIVALLAMGFVVGCGSDSDDGGGSSTGTITGTVLDTDGNAIEGALCSVTDNAKATITDTTDEEGSFVLTGVQAGTWTMTVSATGFDTLSVSVTVSGDQTTEVPTDSTTMTPETFGTVSGTVTNVNTAVAIEGATVAIGTISDTTDTAGAYVLSNVTTGTHTITATADNYASYSGSVTVLADAIVEHDIAMTPVGPDPGYGNVEGVVVDTTGAALAGVEVTVQKGKATTDSNGEYLLSNLDPGETILSYAKSGYTSTTQTVEVIEDDTITAPQITMSTEPEAGTTTLVSKRVNLPEVNNATNPDVSDDGSVVVFESSGNVINNWNAPTGITQAYWWARATGTITRLSNNNNASGSTSGANANSVNVRVSGDGTVAVFQSTATDILANGLSSTNNGDIFYVVPGTSSIDIARVSNNAANSNNGGGAASTVPDIDYDGNVVVFQSLATDIGNITHTGAYSHIYYCGVTKGKAITVGTRRMIDSHNGTESDDGGANPASANPRVSYDGLYTAFQTMADANISANPGTGAATTHIYRNYINDDPATGWNILVSKNNGTEPLAGSTSQLPVINQDGTKIAFQSNGAFNSGDTTSDIFLWTVGQAALTYVSSPLAGTKGASTAANIDNSGNLVQFASLTIGLVSDDTDATMHIFVKDVSTGQNVYTMTSRGSANQVPNAACQNNELSGNGNYAVWDTVATNLTSDTYTAAINDCFIRKYQ